jgi:hypothetical protein
MVVTGVFLPLGIGMPDHTAAGGPWFTP